MTRDELIDELQKSPSNTEVEIFVCYSEDFVCDDDECNHESTVKLERWLKIQSIRTIPTIVLEAGL